LTGSRQLPNHTVPQVTTHFTARVRLTKQVPSAATSSAVFVPSTNVLGRRDIYSIYFHGPAYQVLESAWRDGNRMIGRMADCLPENHIPAEKPTLMRPRLIELCFQTAGLWEMSGHGRMGLPLYVQQACVWQPLNVAKGSLYAVVTPIRDGECFDAEVLDSDGNRIVVLAGYRTVALPTRVGPESMKALHSVQAHEEEVVLT
jgi:hypothetical protein